MQQLGFNSPGIYPYLNFAGKTDAKFDAVYDPFMAEMKLDCIEFSTAKNEIEEQYKDILDKQGIVGKGWDFIKNVAGRKSGSKAIGKQIELYKQGKISEDEIVNIINKYAKGQQKALDFVADWGATVVGAGTFALAVPLLGVGGALGCAAVGGALFKTGAKSLDAYSAGRNYKTAPFDIVTGAINGLLSPIVNGIGSAAMRGVAGALGLRATGGAVSRLASHELVDIIKHFALYPKQKFAGNVVKRAAAFGIGKAVRGVSKFGLALGMRQYIFTAFSRDAISKRTTLGLPGVFNTPEFQDKINKSTPDIDFSNDMYACMAAPQANIEQTGI